MEDGIEGTGASGSCRSSSQWFRPQIPPVSSLDSFKSYLLREPYV